MTCHGLINDLSNHPPGSFGFDGFGIGAVALVIRVKSLGIRPVRVVVNEAVMNERVIAANAVSRKLFGHVKCSGC